MVPVTQEGRLVTMNDTSSNTEASDGVNHIHDPSKQDVDDNNEAHISATNHRELVTYHDESKAKTVAAGGSVSQDVAHKLSSHPSDKEQYSQSVEFTIPSEGYGMVRGALDNSKASISVSINQDKVISRT